ncbi:hypothetical protein JB92DRAFT_3090948 [Gautieria morchelliformis]|nr:hypothetical protein JB92DRAFT_3090948 [Gautieria morchelliformis]
MPHRVLCEICSSQDMKYSCPYCLIQYCSVKCFKEHKEEQIPDVPTLKPLTSLRWPYIPEEPSYADPLKRDEPMPLQLRHYQDIATSPAIRAALSSNPSLPQLLRKVDQLRGTEREEALEFLLGVKANRVPTSFTASPEEVKAMKRLSQAVEKSVRGENAGALGLDWAEDR